VQDDLARCVGCFGAARPRSLTRPRARVGHRSNIRSVCYPRGVWIWLSTESAATE
jgi:hypothetical protein